MTHTFRADAVSLTVVGPYLVPGSALSVLLSGRRIWSFRVPACPGEDLQQSTFSVEWPPMLAERLTGRAALSLEQGGTVVAVEAEVLFDDVDAELRLQDPATGVPFVVNKWGRISASFAGQETSLIEEVLDETERLIAVTREELGIDLFVTGGTLLGPVRDGRVMPHDDDADLAYLSALDNPSDLALENFTIERMLLAHGYEVVRLSAVHLQLMFPGGTVTDRFYIDIFTYFVTGGWFYGTFHAREPAEEVTILPLRPLAVNGRALPGPARPAELLTAIYGANWAVPDPSFTFVTPPAARRRYIGWFADLNMDRENWESHHRGEISSGPRDDPSDFAASVASHLATGSTVVELGAGLGADARYLAAEGHTVIATDYSRPAVAFGRNVAPSSSTQVGSPQVGSTQVGSHQSSSHQPRYEVVNLNSTRETGCLLRELAGTTDPVHVYARSLFDSVSPEATEIALLFAAQLLKSSGGRAYFEFETGGTHRGRAWSEYGAVDWLSFERQLHRHDLVVEDRRVSPAVDRSSTDSDGDRTCINRVIVRAENR